MVSSETSFALLVSGPASIFFPPSRPVDRRSSSHLHNKFFIVLCACGWKKRTIVALADREILWDEGELDGRQMLRNNWPNWEWRGSINSPALWTYRHIIDAAIHCERDGFLSSTLLCCFYVIDLSSRFGARYFPFFGPTSGDSRREIDGAQHDRDDQDLNGPNDSPTLPLLRPTESSNWPKWEQ